VGGSGEAVNFKIQQSKSKENSNSNIQERIPWVDAVLAGPNGRAVYPANLKAKEAPAEVDSQELAGLLLAAIRGPHRPLTAEHFDQLRARARGQVPRRQCAVPRFRSGRKESTLTADKPDGRN
jgi:hypothetical protein